MDKHNISLVFSETIQFHSLQVKEIACLCDKESTEIGLKLKYANSIKSTIVQTLAHLRLLVGLMFSLQNLGGDLMSVDLYIVGVSRYLSFVFLSLFGISNLLLFKLYTIYGSQR